MLFKDVLVEESLKRQLINLVKENRISHAQLFLGPPGSHKFALAVAYAQYLCCENRGDDDSCGVCPSCVQFSKLSHPDFHLIFPNCVTKKVKKDPDYKQFTNEFIDFILEQDYQIDLNDWNALLGGENKQTFINARDCSHIIAQNSIRSYSGGFKIYLLWMVEKLYPSAAPKLLKTLEEPENKTLFILLAENSDNILPTILSRTQLVKIPILNKDTIKSQLAKKYNISEEMAADIAEIADGNYINALKIYQDNGELKEMLRQFQFFMDSSIANINNDLEKVKFIELLDLFNTIISQEREGQKSFIRYMIRMFRNILLLNTNNSALIKATSDEKKVIQLCSPYIRLQNISSIMEACNQAIYHIERNGNSSLIFTDLYLKITDYLKTKK